MSQTLYSEKRGDHIQRVDYWQIGLVPQMERTGIQLSRCNRRDRQKVLAKIEKLGREFWKLFTIKTLSETDYFTADDATKWQLLVRTSEPVLQAYTAVRLKRIMK